MHFCYKNSKTVKALFLGYYFTIACICIFGPVQAHSSDICIGSVCSVYHAFVVDWIQVVLYISLPRCFSRYIKRTRSIVFSLPIAGFLFSNSNIYHKNCEKNYSSGAFSELIFKGLLPYISYLTQWAPGIFNLD